MDSAFYILKKNISTLYITSQWFLQNTKKHPTQHWLSTNDLSPLMCCQLMEPTQYSDTTLALHKQPYFSSALPTDVSHT